MLPEMTVFVLSLYHLHLPLTFGGEANVTRLVRRANHLDFAFDTYKYPLY